MNEFILFFSTVPNAKQTTDTNKLIRGAKLLNQVLLQNNSRNLVRSEKSLMVQEAHTPLSNVSLSQAVRQRADQRTTTLFPSISLQLIHLTFAVFQHRQQRQHADCTRIIRSSPKHVAQGVQEPIQAICDCSTQTFLNIPLVKVVVRVQTEHMPVIQAKRFELPHPRVIHSTGQNGSGIRQQ